MFELTENLSQPLEQAVDDSEEHSIILQPQSSQGKVQDNH